MKPVLGIAYWAGITQYVYTSFTSSRKCGFIFIAQLTFWIGLGWALYFSLPNPDEQILFALIVTQFIVTLGRLYEIRDRNYETLRYDTVLFYWIGFIIATYYLTESNAIPNAQLCISLFVAYAITFLSYSVIHKKELMNYPKCVPEPSFNLYVKSDRYRIIILILLSFLIYLITAFTIKKNGR